MGPGLSLCLLFLRLLWLRLLWLHLLWLHFLWLHFFWLLLLWLLLLWLHLPQGTTPEGLADIRLCIEAFREQLKVFQMVKADARDMAKQLEHLDSFG